MALVTLIQKLETDVRDAVVQIEDWILPKAAMFTNTVDEAGRKIYSLFESDVKPVVAGVVSDAKADAKKAKADVLAAARAVKADAKAAADDAKAEAAKVIADAKADANTVESKSESLLDELKTEIKDIEAKVEGLFKKGN